jgi:tubulin epsilon
MSALVASNNCGVAVPLRSLYQRFLALYRVRAHLHHYLEYVDGDSFQEAAVVVDGIVKDYESFAS